MRRCVWMGLVLALSACDGGGGQPKEGPEPASAAPCSPLGADAVSAGASGSSVGTVGGVEVSREAYEAYLFDRYGHAHWDAFVVESLVAERAKERGLTIPAELLEKQAEAAFEGYLRDAFGVTVEQAEAVLGDARAVEATRKAYRERVRTNLLLKALILKDRGVDDASLKAVFEERYGKDGVKERVAHVFFAKGEASFYGPKQYEAERDAVRERVLKEVEGYAASGETLSELALKHGDDPGHDGTGDLGQTWAGRWGDGFDAAVAGLAVGERSGVVHSAEGAHVIEVTGEGPRERYVGRVLKVPYVMNGRSLEVIRREGEERAEAAAKALKASGFEAAARSEGVETVQGEVAPMELDAVGGAEAESLLGSLGASVGVVVVPGRKAAYVVEVTGREASGEPVKSVRHLYVSWGYAAERKRRMSAEVSAAARERAEEALEKIRAGETFAVVAQAMSEDPMTAASGGVLPEFEPGAFGEAFAEAVSKLEVGGVSEVVESLKGFHVVMLLEREETPFEAVRGELERLQLEGSVRDDERAMYISELKRAAGVSRGF